MADPPVTYKSPSELLAISDPIADGDLFIVTDISDTTQSPAGSTVKATGSRVKELARPFSAILSDGTLSTGGDYEGSDAIVNAVAALGKQRTFYIRRGAYTLQANGDINNRGLHLIGEGVYDGDNDAAVAISQRTGVITGQNVKGVHEKIHFMPNTGNDSPWNMYGKFVDCLMEPNTYVHGASFSGSERFSVIFSGCQWRQIATPNAAVNYTFALLGAAVNPHSVRLESCYFEAPTGSAAALNTIRIDTIDYKATFANCIIQGGTDISAIEMVSSAGGDVTFDGCHITGACDDAYLIKASTNSGTGRMVFRDCVFESDNGLILDAIDTSVTFIRCKFTTGATAPTSGKEQAFILRGSGEHILEDCQFHLGNSSIDDASVPSATGPVIEIGGANATADSDATIQKINGLHVFNEGSLQPNYAAIGIWGSDGTSAPTACVMNDILYDAGDVAASGNDTGMSGGLTSGAYIEIIGAPSPTWPTYVSNVRVTKLNRGNNTDEKAGIYLKHINGSGLAVDWEASGTGKLFEGVAVVYLHESYVTGVDIQKDTGGSLGDFTNGRVAILASDSTLRDCNVWDCTATTHPTFMVEVGERCTVDSLKTTDAALNTSTAYFSLTGKQARIINCQMEPSSASWDRFVQDNASGGGGHMVVGNIFRQAGTGTTFIDLTEDNCIVDSNILIANTGTATITNTGTGSVTGDNVAV